MAAVATLALSLTLPAAQVQPKRWQQIAKVLGAPGEVRGDAFRVEFGPLITRVRAGRARLGPGAFDPPWVTFQEQGGVSVMLGRLLIPAAQAARAIDKLVKAGIDVTAAVDPYPGASPGISVIYFRETGDPAPMAKALHQAMGQTLHAPPDKPRPSAVSLDVRGIERVMGRSGNVEAGALVFRVEREETVKCCGLEKDPLLVFSGIPLGPATGFVSRIAFEGNLIHATVSGRLLVKRDESASVEQALAAFGIETTGLMEVFPDEQPRILFLYFLGTGKPLELAQGMRAAIERTNHAPSEPAGRL